MAAGHVAEPWSQPFHSIRGSGPRVTTTTKRAVVRSGGGPDQQRRVCTALGIGPVTWGTWSPACRVVAGGAARPDNCPSTPFSLSLPHPWEPGLVSYLDPRPAVSTAFSRFLPPRTQGLLVFGQSMPRRSAVRNTSVKASARAGLGVCDSVLALRAGPVFLLCPFRHKEYLDTVFI